MGSERRPFHESLPDIIREADDHGQLMIIERLIRATRIPKNHLEIGLAWDEALRKNGITSDCTNVKFELVEQENEARAEAKAKEKEVNKSDDHGKHKCLVKSDTDNVVWLLDNQGLEITPLKLGKCIGALFRNAGDCPHCRNMLFEALDPSIRRVTAAV